MPTDTAQPLAANEDACPALEDACAFREYFHREGYIVLRNAVPPAVCAEAVDGFLKEVHLDNHALFLRDSPSRYEPHAYTDAGHMRHPIVNLQDISGRRYPQFKAAGLALLTDPVLRRALHTLLGEPARLARTMYFDGNQTALPQRDSDDTELARTVPMIGAWIAAEDIDPGSGRFFVLPGSHLQALPESLAHGTRPKAAPVLKQGDALLWSAMTIHGSLPSTAPACSRRAFTGHYIGQSDTVPRGAAGSVVLDGMEVLQYRNHRSLAGRAASLFRSGSPRAFTLLQRLKALL